LIIDVKELRDPLDVALNYLKGKLIPDIIAVIPYSLFRPHLIILRYFKLVKFRTYQKYLMDFIIDSCASFIEK